MTSKTYFTKREASEYLTGVLGLPTSEKTLSKYITIGGGPSYQKFGTKRIVYKKESLDEWVDKRLSKVVQSSSQI